MFIRTEKSVKEFMQFYPVVSTLVIIHLALWFIIDFLQLPLGIRLYQWGAGNNLFIYQGEYWRLLTAIFLHNGLMHALVNSFSLVLFGPALEQMLGKIKFIIAYIGAGLIANLATFFIDPATFYSHVGASGAIFGLFGIYVYMIVFRKDLIDQANAQIILVIFIIGLIMTFLRPGINVYAHVFGFIGGFVIARLVLGNAQAFSHWRNQRKQSHGSVQFNPNRWKRRRRLPGNSGMNIIWIILVILSVIGILSRLF